MKIRPRAVITCDVLVVGGGLAGCVAAITAKEKGTASVVLVDKGKVSRSGQSSFAAGIWALNLPEDDLDTWIEETIVNGDYWNDQEWVRLLWERNYEVVQKVEEWCGEAGKRVFERTAAGEFVRRKSRGHIRTWHGVINSLAMMEGLRHKAKAVGVELIERLMITDLICIDGTCWGATGFNYRTGETYLILARKTILAAAGAGFKSIFMGHRNLTGDLQAVAWREGVILQNMENIAHNTSAKLLDTHGMNLYVSVGGKWVNSLGEEFMWDYDPVLGNRCNQPVMCIGLAREVHEGRGPILFDMSAATPEDRALCRKILPESFRAWDAAQIDPFTQPVEWVTAFFGTINNGGGIRIGLDCATNLKNLYAAGDITPIPPHGGYSFGGVNIAFTGVSGRVAGEAVVRDLGGTEPDGTVMEMALAQAQDKLGQVFQPLAGGTLEPDELIAAIQAAVIPYRVSLIKNRTTLQAALTQVETIKEKLGAVGARDLHQLVKANEAKNLATIAELMLRAALYRKESRGFHFREDYPVVDNVNWLKWILMQLEDGQIKIWTEDVPTPYVKPPHAYQRHRSLRQNVLP